MNFQKKESIKVNLAEAADRNISDVILSYTVMAHINQITGKLYQSVVYEIRGMQSCLHYNFTLRISELDLHTIGQFHLVSPCKYWFFIQLFYCFFNDRNVCKCCINNLRLFFLSVLKLNQISSDVRNQCGEFKLSNKAAYRALAIGQKINDFEFQLKGKFCTQYF